MSTPKIAYAKMDINLDNSRKIRRAGRNGRDVYLWVLRQVAMRDSEGEMPAVDLEDHEWLADQLMCSVADVREGIEAAKRTSLIDVVDGVCFVVGWGDEWAKRTSTGAERQARYKKRRLASPGDGGDGAKSEVTEVTEPRHPVTEVTEGDGGDAGKERKERKESERHPGEAPGLFSGVPVEPKPPTPAETLSAVACAEINRLTGSRFDPATKATADLCVRLAKAGHTPDEALLVIRDKHREWSPNPEMRQRIVPGTLLALANFEKYLDELRSRPSGARDGPYGSARASHPPSRRVQTLE